MAATATRKAKDTSEIPRNVTLGDAAWCAMEKHWPGRTVDDLLCTPDDAKKVCKEVRAQFSDARDPEICRALLNGRKQGRFEPKHRKVYRK